MSDKPKRVLLSGARGCLGRAFKAYMAREHPEVDIFDFLPFPFSFTALADHLKSGTYFALVNLAGLGNDRESHERPFDYFETNAFGVVKQLEAIRQFAPQCRYLCIGTTYEKERNSPYAVSKRMMRQAVESYRQNHGLYAVVATLSNTEYYGRDESYLARRVSKGVARIARAIQKGESFEPISLQNIHQTFYWTWAEDVADGMWRTLNQVNPIHDYHLIMPFRRTLDNFVQSAFASAGLAAKWLLTETGYALVIGEGYPERRASVTVLANSTEDSKDCLGTEPLKEAWYPVDQLGWNPRFSTEHIAAEMVKYDLSLLDNEEKVA